MGQIPRIFHPEAWPFRSKVQFPGILQQGSLLPSAAAPPRRLGQGKVKGWQEQKAEGIDAGKAADLGKDTVEVPSREPSA